MDWKSKYEDLMYDYRKLQGRYEELEEKYRGLDDDLYSANCRIRSELEPRIQQEKRAYDNWVTDIVCSACGYTRKGEGGDVNGFNTRK